MTNYLKVYLLILIMFFLPAYTDSHHPQEFLNSVAGKKNEGELIYNHFCINCHAKKPLIALGAPRIEENDDWQPRLEQGIDALFRNTNEGMNGMPPRGGCFECTDEQLILAIVTLVPKKYKKVVLNQLKAHKKSI